MPTAYITHDAQKGFSMLFRYSLQAVLFIALMASIAGLGATITPAAPDGLHKATFAGGCFWCMESPFESLDGVAEVTVGYTGGDLKNPSYEQISAGDTGHAEAVEIVFDPKKISYEKLLDVFWHNVDPTQRDRQFCDVGDQYRSAIFYHSPEQEQQALASKTKLEQSDRFANKQLYTQIAPAGSFYVAEKYHQDYAIKNPIRYKYYRWNCGRDERLEEVWGQAPTH